MKSKSKLVMLILLIMTFTLIGCSKDSEYTLTYSIVGQGTVTPKSGSSYEANTLITLTATPANLNWYFAGWGGTDGHLVTAQNKLFMDGPKSLTVIFYRNNLYGQVLDQITNLGIANAQVIVRKTTNEEQKLTTDAEGRFSLTLGPGDYFLTVIAAGYFNSLSSRLTIESGTDPSTPVVTNLSFALYPTNEVRELKYGSFVGKVRDAKTGQPQANVEITVNHPALAAPILTRTDADGNYFVYGLVAASDYYSDNYYTYNITASVNGYIAVTKSCGIVANSTRIENFSLTKK